MQKKIYIETEDIRTRLALLEDGEVVEYYQERPGRAKLAGNIYVGRVENVLPGMQAAFVDIGLDKNAFLHLGDIQVSRSEFGEELERIQNMRVFEKHLVGLIFCVMVTERAVSSGKPVWSGDAFQIFSETAEHR